MSVRETASTRVSAAGSCHINTRMVRLTILFSKKPVRVRWSNDRIGAGFPADLAQLHDALYLDRKKSRYTDLLYSAEMNANKRVYLQSLTYKRKTRACQSAQHVL